MPDVLLVNRDLPEDGAPVRQVSGAAESAQNIVEALYTPLGSLPWDRSAGSTFTEILNAQLGQQQAVAELRRVAIATPGVYPQSVDARYDAFEQRYLLSFTGLTGSFTLALA